MNELHLTKILKGHEGEMFWNPLLGDVELYYLDNDVVIFRHNNSYFNIPDNGLDMFGNLVLFPSMEQRDWNVWAEENNIKFI